MNRTAAYIC